MYLNNYVETSIIYADILDIPERADAVYQEFSKLNDFNLVTPNNLRSVTYAANTI